MRRERIGESAPFWRFSAASYPDLGTPNLEKPILGSVDKTVNGTIESSSGVSAYGLKWNRKYQKGFEDNIINLLFCLIFKILKGDVYPVEPYEIFSMNQVLDAHWGVLNDEDVSSISFSKCNDIHWPTKELLKIIPTSLIHNATIFIWNYCHFAYDNAISCIMWTFLNLVYCFAKVILPFQKNARCILFMIKFYWLVFVANRPMLAHSVNPCQRLTRCAEHCYWCIFS